MRIPFKYNTPDTFSDGEAINGYDSFIWTERYREPSTFEFEAKLSSGLMNFLPIGTLISHTQTLEVMMVENHQISDEVDADPKLKITGRSLECMLDERVVGQNWNWAVPPASLEVSVYTLSANYTWIQAVELINGHIQTGTVINSDDAIPSVLADHSVSGTSVSESRIINRGSVLVRLLELLEIDDLGCRVIRRHNFSDRPNPGSNTTMLIHNGEDKLNTIKFSTTNGDIDIADYLWSIKNYKTAALVTGKFVEQFVPGTATGLERRVLHVDGSDLDGYYETIPTGGTLTSVRAAMTVRANQALKAQKRIALSRLDISSTPTYEYRHDYNIGDLVSIDSNYGEILPMRVIEFVEIQDETGESAHPTLEII